MGFYIIDSLGTLDFFSILKTLNILCLLYLSSSLYRRFSELLAFAQLTHGACLVELSLKSL